MRSPLCIALILSSFFCHSQADSLRFSRFYITPSIDASMVSSKLFSPSRYYIIVPRFESTFNYRISSKVHVGATVGGMRSASSHNERFFAQMLGVQLEYHFYQKNAFGLYFAGGYYSFLRHTKLIPPSSNNPLSTKKRIEQTEHSSSLPLTLGTRVQLHTKHLDLSHFFFSPEIVFYIPIGPQSIPFNPLSSIGFYPIKFSVMFST